MATTAVFVIVLLLLALIWVPASLHAKRVREQNRDKLLQPNEEFVCSTRQDPIALVGVGFVAFIGLVVFVFSLVLVVHYPAIDYQLPGYHTTGLNVQPPHIHIPLEWIPVVVFIAFTLLTVWMEEEWRLYQTMFTTERVLRWTQNSIVLPLMRQKLDQTPLELIVDIDDKSGILGGIGNWGTITIGNRLMDASDEKQPDIVLRLVPDYLEYASTLRELLGAFRVKLREAQQPKKTPLEEDYLRLSVMKLRKDLGLDDKNDTDQNGVDKADTNPNGINPASG